MNFEFNLVEHSGEIKRLHLNKFYKKYYYNAFSKAANKRTLGRLAISAIFYYSALYLKLVPSILEMQTKILWLK